MNLSIPILLFIAALLANSVSAQTVDRKKLRHLKVSQAERERLADRLAKFIELEIKKDFETQFEMVPTNCPAYLYCWSGSKAEYVNYKMASYRMYGELIELKLGKVEGRLKDNCVGIPLSPKLKDGKKIYFNASASVACIKNGEWYLAFSYVEI
ncbi:MAG TPA: hypothetical protein PKA82_11710 [Pyrinomonadaceae bacterium]|nr:hypothetical protein [Pyrinomonadaceae bacterium]